jgi:hypothetical protein
MDYLWVKTLKQLGYYDDHEVGEEINIPIKQADELIKKGYVEILVNNQGNNLPYNETENEVEFAEVLPFEND